MNAGGNSIEIFASVTRVVAPTPSSVRLSTPALARPLVEDVRVPCVPRYNTLKRSDVRVKTVPESRARLASEQYILATVGESTQGRDESGYERGVLADLVGASSPTVERATGLVIPHDHDVASVAAVLYMPLVTPRSCSPVAAVQRNACRKPLDAVDRPFAPATCPSTPLLREAVACNHHEATGAVDVERVVHWMVGLGLVDPASA